MDPQHQPTGLQDLYGEGDHITYLSKHCRPSELQTWIEFVQGGIWGNPSQLSDNSGIKI